MVKSALHKRFKRWNLVIPGIRIPVTIRRTVLASILGMVALAACIATPARAEDPAAAATVTSPDPQNQGQPTPAADQKKRPQGGQAQVMTTKSIFFPDLAYSVKPLSPGEKFKLSLLNSVSPGAFFGSAFGAGIAQAADSPTGYGQGAEGYGKRFGSSLATNAANNLLGTFLLASIAHHDPRFFVEGDGSLGQSLKFGIKRVVVTRTDSGKPAFNWDGLLSPLLASAFANAYQPDAERTAGKTFERYGYSIATIAGINVLKEFWPTITRKILVPIGMGGLGSKPANTN